MALTSHEAGTTIQFTVTFSTAPDQAPMFQITAASGSSIISSVTATTSGSTAYFALFTMPGSTQYMMETWTASATVGGTVFPFVKRGGFKVILSGVKT